MKNLALTILLTVTASAQASSRFLFGTGVSTIQRGEECLITNEAAKERAIDAAQKDANDQCVGGKAFRYNAGNPEVECHTPGGGGLYKITIDFECDVENEN